MICQCLTASELGRLPRNVSAVDVARPFLVRRFSRLFTMVEAEVGPRAGRSTIGGWVAGGAGPVLLVETTGRRSGHRREPPLLLHRDVDQLRLNRRQRRCRLGSGLVPQPPGGTRIWELEIDGAVPRRESATVRAPANERTTAWPSAVHALPD